WGPLPPHPAAMAETARIRRGRIRRLLMGASILRAPARATARDAERKLEQMGLEASNRPGFRSVTVTIVEILLWVGLATGIVAFLNQWASVTALGSIYLLCVLAVAVRRGQVAAMFTSVACVAALNFFFVPPLHQFSVSDSEDLVALGVLLIAALVVGRLAGTARERTAEAERRAETALAR